MTERLDSRMAATISEVRDYAHRLGATRLTALMATLDGEALIDYRPGDWLRITVDGKTFVLPPDWELSWSE